MHIAHFIHRYPPAVGGAEAYVERLSRFLVQQGDEVRVWTSAAVELNAMWFRGFEERSAGEEVHDGITIQRFRPLTFPGRRYAMKVASLVPIASWQALTLPCNPASRAWWAAAGSYIGPVDVVHAFAFPYAFVAAAGLRLARRRRVPFVLTPFLHLGDPTNPADRTRRQYTSHPLRWLLRQADRVFAQTPSEAAAIVGLGVPPDRVILQGLGVDLAECTGGNRDAARSAWGVGESEVVVGHLANLSIEKGTVDLLAATAELPVKVVLAGPAMPNFLHTWDRHPAKDRVVRLGRLSESAKRDFFAGIDVFCLPSRSDSFGLVLLEAWANGVLVVAYRAGGPADLVRDGNDGFLVPCGDVGALRNCLRAISVDRELRRRFGSCGQSRIATEFAWADKLARVRSTLAGLVKHQ